MLQKFSQNVLSQEKHILIHILLEQALPNIFSFSFLLLLRQHDCFLASPPNNVLTPRMSQGHINIQFYPVIRSNIVMKNALNNVHTSGVSKIKELPSLKLLTAKLKHLQSRLQAIRKDRQFQNFLQSCDTKEDRARLISSGGPLTGKWLEAIPCSQNFCPTNAQFRTAAFMRLG